MGKKRKKKKDKKKKKPTFRDPGMIKPLKLEKDIGLGV